MLKIHFLRNILLASLTVVVMFPLYDIFVAYPKFIKALSEEATDQSVRISGHLSSSLNLPGILMYSDITAIDATEIEAIRQDLNIMKIKLFSANGDVIYSTDPQDMSNIHDRTVFQQTIARGTVYSKVKGGGTRSLEGTSIRSAQFVETYVPIMKGDRFLGAIEIYYDMTAARERFDRIRSDAIFLVIVLASGLFALVCLTSFKASSIIIERNQIAEEREKLIVKLQEAIEKVKTLRGLLPICCSCNRIRDKREKWTNVDVYISRHSEAEFTHCYCPDCAEFHFPKNG